MKSIKFNSVCHLMRSSTLSLSLFFYFLAAIQSHFESIIISVKYLKMNDFPSFLLIVRLYIILIYRLIDLSLNVNYSSEFRHLCIQMCTDSDISWSFCVIWNLALYWMLTPLIALNEAIEMCAFEWICMCVCILYKFSDILLYILTHLVYCVRKSLCLW